MNSARRSLICLVLIAVLTVGAQSQTEVIDSVEVPIIPEEALEEALKGIKLTPSDFSFRTDYVELDSFRLPIVDSFTLRPLDMIGFANDVSTELFRDREQSIEWLIDFETTDFRVGRRLSSIQSLTGDSIELPQPQKRFDAECISGRVDSLRHHLRRAYGACIRVKTETDEFFGALSPDELAFVRDTFPQLLLEDVEDEFRSVEELDSIQQLEDGYSKRFIPIAEKLVSDRSGWSSLKQQAIHFGHLMASLARRMRESLPDTCSFIYEIPTEHGKIAVGGTGRNQYSGQYICIIDIGGNDTYELDQIEAPQFIYDLSGNDSYSSLSDFAIASGFMYPAYLHDLEGDDIYSAGNFSLGSGLFSVGVLIDSCGNDQYIGDTHTQGAGTFGVGVLIDESGTDSYRCALFGQAFAFVQGLGVLCDINGNDMYFAGGKYKDVLRYKDHYLSLSQGFAYGLRPTMSGGAAILADSAGHDTYVSDIFGQGSSYWYALGIQTDFGGNDKYLSFQYAQGVGTHLTLGVLLDKTGDDYYFAKGVSQGCGHDLAAGFLVDYFGNDTYQSNDLSQGAGSANGVGWLVDYRGDDSYQIKGRHNTQGYGNPRRDYGSIGLFMDLMGKDEYIGNGADSTIWIIDSKWGIGVDFDYWNIDSTGASGE